MHDEGERFRVGRSLFSMTDMPGGRPTDMQNGRNDGISNGRPTDPARRTFGKCVGVPNGRGMRLVLRPFLCYTGSILNADSLKAVIRLFSPEAGGRPALEAAMSSVRFLKSCPGSGRDPFLRAQCAA